MSLIYFILLFIKKKWQLELTLTSRSARWIIQTITQTILRFQRSTSRHRSSRCLVRFLNQKHFKLSMILLINIPIYQLALVSRLCMILRQVSIGRGKASWFLPSNRCKSWRAFMNVTHAFSRMRISQRLSKKVRMVPPERGFGRAWSNSFTLKCLSNLHSLGKQSSKATSCHRLLDTFNSTWTP